MAFVKIIVLLVLFFILYRMAYWRHEAQWFENQAKDRQYQVQRLQFKIENMKAKPGSLCFFGDSIILLWPTQWYFPGSYNRGISSETTEMMLLRFKEDVIDLHPRTVVIVGGANDPAHHIPPIATKENLASLVLMAENNHIRHLIVNTKEILGGHPEYFFDRVHPNLRGYEAMSQFVKKAFHDVR